MADMQHDDAPVPKPDDAKATIPTAQDAGVPPAAAPSAAAASNEKPVPPAPLRIKANDAGDKTAADGADEAAAPTKTALKTTAASAASVKKAIARDRVDTSREPAKKSVTRQKPASPAKKAKAAMKARSPVARKAAPLKGATVNKAAKQATSTPDRPTGTKSFKKNTEITIMAKNTEEMTNTVKNAMGEMSSRSKAALEKSSHMMSQAGEFAKGNVEALVESNKIFAAGLQDLGREALADSKAEFETLTAEMKDMAAVKSPTDFFQMQSTFLRKQFDKAVALGSKNTEAMLKLANEASQPLSNRMSVAVEKAKFA